MKHYTDDTYEGKEEYVNDLSKFVRLDPHSNLLYLSYTADSKQEIVTVVYKGGHEVKINVNHNSLGAIFMEVAREIYGSGAYGRIGMF